MHLMCRLSGAFVEIVQDVNIFRALQKVDAKETPIRELENCLARCNILKDSLLQIQDAIERTPVSALCKGEVEN